MPYSQLLRQVVGRAPPKGDQERLRRDVVGHLGAEPAGHVTMDLLDVAIEEPGEPLRVIV